MKLLPHRAIVPAIHALEWCTARYIANQKRRALAASKPLSAAQRTKLNGFFLESLLSETRVSHSKVPNPWFYPLASPIGIHDLPEVGSIGAITFVDLIVSPGRLSIETLFHELVHVTQYRALGLRGFARRYVAGLLRTGAYITIPLEVQAYELEDRFRRDAERLFSVIADVEQRLDAGLF
jgi:hypothetical protein